MPLKLLAAALALTALAACSRPGAPKRPLLHGERAPIAVVTTFSTLNSFVEAVGGKRVRVQNLVPIGVSPEDYQPTPQDIATLNGAQLLVENGAGIEAWLQRTIANVGNADLKIVVLSHGLPIKDKNPHLWMDPELAKSYVRRVRDALIEIDPRNRDYYMHNARLYFERLDRLEAYISREIDTIPPQRRTMIVYHNAWLYYDDRFGIRTVGVIELSPGQDPNPAYIAELVDLAKKYKVRAVFAEPEYSPKLADALAQSAGIKTVRDLYDDSIGEGPHVKDYISMLRYDTRVIVRALK